MGGRWRDFVVFAVIITGNDPIFNGPFDIKLDNLEGDWLKPPEFPQNLTLAVRQLSGIITTYLKSHFISRCISFQSQVAPTQRSRVPAQTRSQPATEKYILPLSWSLSEAGHLGLFHFNKKSVLWASRGIRLPFWSTNGPNLSRMDLKYLFTGNNPFWVFNQLFLQMISTYSWERVTVCLHSSAAQTRLSSNARGRCRHPGSVHLSWGSHLLRLLTTNGEPGQRKIQRRLWELKRMKIKLYFHIRWILWN